MNERIKELYEQSLIRENTKDANGNPMIVIKQNPKKFAESIVKECMSKAKQGKLTNMNGDQIAWVIKEHFEVEE